LSNGIWGSEPESSERRGILYSGAAISDSDVSALGAYHLGAGRPFALDEAHRSAADMSEIYVKGSDVAIRAGITKATGVALLSNRNSVFG
jgi:hypothetical protein